MNYEIDLKNAKTRADLYDLLEQELPLPDYFGRNLDALYDVLSEIPEDLREGFVPYVKPDTGTREYRIVKAADKLSAYIKCVEELKYGNAEFKSAKASIRKQLDEMALPELDVFLVEFADSFEKTLDELAGGV